MKDATKTMKTRKAMKPARRLATATLTVGLALSGAGAEASPGPGPVPLREGFSSLEVGLALTAAAGGVFLATAGPGLLPAPSPSLGVPGRGSLDARLSRELYRPGQGRFLGGAPDLIGGYVLPVLPVLAYGIPALSSEWAGWNAPHRLMAYVEAIGITYLTTGVIKFAVGRPRPYTEAANNHPELRKRSGEDDLSFFSGHASSAFAVGAFVAEDGSRYLRGTALANSGTGTRFLVGWLLPYAVGYGVPAVVGLSRIIDQQHWPSDVLVGGLVGTVIGQLVYRIHFDSEGHPRRRNLARTMRAVPLLGSDRHGGQSVQLALVGSF